MPTQTKFLHLRRLHKDTNELSPLGGVTIALEDAEGGVKVGIAVCHEKDHYVKKEGRARAAGRLHSKAAENAKFRAQIANTTADEVIAMLYNQIPEREDVVIQLNQVMNSAGAKALISSR